MIEVWKRVYIIYPASNNAVIFGIYVKFRRCSLQGTDLSIPLKREVRNITDSKVIVPWMGLVFHQNEV